MRTFAFLIALFSLGTGTLFAQSASGTPTNFSTLVTLPPGGSITLGFVASSVPANTTAPVYLVRAVGFSLAQFGITNGCPSVSLQAFDSSGQSAASYQLLPQGAPFDWPAIFASVGAFPVYSQVGGPISGLPTPDAYQLYSFPNGGAFTFKATDTSGKGGQVLVEAYYNAQVILALGVLPD